MSRSSRSTVLAHFSRRRLLQGLAAGASVGVGLPIFESLFDPSKQARANALGFPERFGVYFWGNGNRPDQWTPTGEGVGYTLSESLAPLAGLESKLSVLTGLQVRVPNSIPHWSSAGGLMAGSVSLGDDNDSWTPAGPTIDQIVAAQIGNDTIYRSIETSASTTSSMSYTGPYAQNPSENDPFAFFERIFGVNFTAGGGEPSPTLGWRRSVLDSVMADMAELRPVLGSADQIRLDQHLTGVRDLEIRLGRLLEDPPQLDACLLPSAPAATFPDVGGLKPLSEISRAFCDMIAMTLACDQTRVFSHMFTAPLNNERFAGMADGHHNLTHDETGDQPQVQEITRLCIEEYAYLLRALDAIPEGDETLLDHCLVMGATECSEGRTHALDEIPLLYAGSACGRLKTGFHYRSFSQDNAGKAMLSMVRAMGVAAADWGADDVYTTDGLSEIEV